MEEEGTGSLERGGGAAAWHEGAAETVIFISSPQHTQTRALLGMAVYTDPSVSKDVCMHGQAV